jgi:hypothetical protein
MEFDNCQVLNNNDNGNKNTLNVIHIPCTRFLTQYLIQEIAQTIIKSKRAPSIFKDESTRSCICLWKLAVAVATYVSICIVYRVLPSFVF